MPLLSDEELVQCCKSELPYETRSFEQLVNRYKDRVFGKAFSMIRNEQDAEDLAQTVFMKVFQAIPSFRGEAKFSTWLYTITVNTCLNYQDKMQRRPWWRRADDIDEVNKAARQDEDMFNLVGRSLEREELMSAISQALAKMNPASRDILQLRFFDELDYKTISNKLNIGLSAAKMRLKRARLEFRNLFESQFKDL